MQEIKPCNATYSKMCAYPQNHIEMHEAGREHVRMCVQILDIVFSG